MSRSIVLAIEIDASPARVFEALTTQDGLASFWTPDVETSTEVGASLRLGFAAAPVDLQMTVVKLEEDRRVEWECGGPWPNWGGTRVEWTVLAAEATSVTFVHNGWADEVSDLEFGSVALTWAMVLQALKAYVETGHPAPALA